MPERSPEATAALPPQAATPSRRPVRVAFCIDNMNIGGTELNAVRTAERLIGGRCHLQVVCLQDSGPLLERYASAGIPVQTFRIRNLYGPRAVDRGLALARWLRANRIEILHAHDIYSNVFGVFWGRMAGVKTIASRRWWEGFPQPHWKAASRLGYALADAALANSDSVADLLRREGVPDRKIEVVPNFLDEHAFESLAGERRAALRGELGLRPEHRAIGIVANLLPVKDHASLLRAFAPLASEEPQLRLVMVGEGGERGALEALSASLGIADRVVFAGRRPNDPNPHQLFEISVQSSYSEGLPNSVLEAMAAARPVVATDVGAVADAVVDGETGLLVPARDPERLSAALRALLDDPRRARQMGDAGRARAEQRYSAASALDRLEALYQRLAPRPGRPDPAAASPSRVPLGV